MTSKEKRPNTPALTSELRSDAPPPAADDAPLECPICHKRNGQIDGSLIKNFICPDCSCMISYCDNPFDCERIASRIRAATAKQN